MPLNNALHTAAEAGNLAKVQLLVHNFDINAKGQWDQTALFKAAENGKTDVVKFLLTLNPDVNIPSVRMLKMIFAHLTCISPIPNICHTSLPLIPTTLLLKIVAEVPPSTF